MEHGLHNSSLHIQICIYVLFSIILQYKVYICTYIYTYIYVFIYIRIYIYMYIYIYVYVYVYIYVYIYIHVYIYICIYICIHTYTYIYIYAYIHIYTRFAQSWLLKSNDQCLHRILFSNGIPLMDCDISPYWLVESPNESSTGFFKHEISSNWWFQPL